MSNNGTINYEPSGDTLADQRWLMSQGMSLEAANETIHQATKRNHVDLRAHKRPTAPQAESQSVTLSSLQKQYMDAGDDFDTANEKAFKALKSPAGTKLLSLVQMPNTPSIGSMAGAPGAMPSAGTAKADAEALSKLGTKLSAKAIADYIKSQASVDDVGALLGAVGARLDQLAVTQPDAVAALRKQWFAEAGVGVSPMKELGPNSILFDGRVYRARRAG